MEPQRLQITKAILRNNKAGGITPQDFKLYYIAIIIKIVWNQHKNRHIDQQNRTENPEVNSHIYGQFMTKYPRIYNQERTVSLINGVGKNWAATCKGMKLDLHVTLYTKINSNGLNA